MVLQGSGFWTNYSVCQVMVPSTSNSVGFFFRHQGVSMNFRFLSTRDLYVKAFVEDQHKPQPYNKFSMFQSVGIGFF